MDPIEQVKFPVLLRKSSYSKLWYKPDTMFSVPKAFVNIEFNCPHVRDSPQAEVLANIFVQLLDDYLNEHGKLLVSCSFGFLVFSQHSKARSPFLTKALSYPLCFSLLRWNCWPWLFYIAHRQRFWGNFAPLIFHFATVI